MSTAKRLFPHLLSLLATGFLLVAPPASAAGTCVDTVLAQDGQTQFNPASGLFEGDLVFLVDGRRRTFGTETLLLGIESADERGVLTSRTSHEFRIRENGTRLVTFDRATLIPTDSPGVFDFTSHLTITTGTRFGCGEILSKGSINLATGTLTLFEWVSDGAGGQVPGTVGRICSCR